MVTLDGALGEGGGQILRSAVSLSAITGRGLRIFNIRAGRPNPGLQKQHLVALQAARDVSGSVLTGGAVGSTEITFSPPPAGAVPPPLRAEYAFDIGSAGSTTLVFQTVLPILLARLPRGSGASVDLTIVGGTHNPMAPSAAFLAAVVAPALRAAGADVEVTCARAGFYPAGGGVLRATVRALPAGAPQPAPALLAGGAVARFRATVLATAALPRAVAAREAAALAAALSLPPREVAIEVPDAKGPGNAVLVALDREGGALGELVCVCGERGVSAEAVAGAAAVEARALAASSAPFSEHAADQLLLPLLVMGGGAFRAVSVGKGSKHFETNVAVCDAFVGGGGEGVTSCVAVAPARAEEGAALHPGVVVTVAAVRLVRAMEEAQGGASGGGGGGE